VLYVPSLRRSLVSGSSLNKDGLKLVIEVDKVILANNGNFLGKGYLVNGVFFFFNIVCVIANGSISCSAYIVESVNLWHDILGHVNFGSIKRLKNMHLINASNENECSKCTVCV